MERRTDTNPPSSVNRTPDRASEPYLGGADAVEKTSDLSDVHGAEVNDREPPPVPLTADVPDGGGLGTLGWVALVLVLLIVVVYLAARFT